MRATLHVMTTTDYIAMRGAMQPMLTGGMESILRGRGAAVDLEIIEVEARKFFGKSAATFDALRDHFKAKFPDSDERAMAYAIRTHVPLVQVPHRRTMGIPGGRRLRARGSMVVEEGLHRGNPVARHVSRCAKARAVRPAGRAEAGRGYGSAGSIRPRLRQPRALARRPIEDHHRRASGSGHAQNLQLRATFLVDGMVAGTWKSERKRDTAVLVIEPFGSIPKRVKVALEEEGDELLAFLEADALEREVRWAT